MENNIFKFATKELSQDAFLAWLINWLNIKENNENKAIRKCANNFLKKILENNEKWKNLLEENEIDIQGIEVQFFSIDVLILLKNKKNDEYLAIIIEDKVNTSEHDAQIEYYKYNLYGNLDKKRKYKNNIQKEKLEILTVYYKPYDECNIEEKNVDYIFSRKTIIETFKNHNEVRQEYFKQYMEYINAIEECAQNYNNDKYRCNEIVEKKERDIKYFSFFKTIKDGSDKSDLYNGNNGYQSYIDNNINKSKAETQLVKYYGEIATNPKSKKGQEILVTYTNNEKIWFNLGTNKNGDTWWCNLPLNFQIKSNIFNKYAFIKINFYKDKNKSTIMLKFSKKRKPVDNMEEYKDDKKVKESFIYFCENKEDGNKYKYKLCNTFDTRVFKNKKQVYEKICEKLIKTNEYCKKEHISIQQSKDGRTKTQPEINIFTINFEKLNVNIEEQMKIIKNLIKNIIDDLNDKVINVYTDNEAKLKAKWI